MFSTTCLSQLSFRLVFSLSFLALPLSALAEQKAYVIAEQCVGLQIGTKCLRNPLQAFAHGVGGLFNEPKSLSIQPDLTREKRTDYSIGQLILADANALKSIEFGWLVAPGAYHDDKPHLFIALRKPPNPEVPCFIVPKGYANPGGKNWPPCPDNVWSGRLSHNKQPGDAVGETAQPMMYHVGYYAGNKAWWIQYGDEWIAWVSGSWWGDGGFAEGNVIQWYGEITYATNACIPMGNGLYGTNPGSTRISNMFYEIMQGNMSISRNAEATVLETDANGWNANTESKNRKINSFHYGGPGRFCAISQAR